MLVCALPVILALWQHWLCGSIGNYSLAAAKSLRFPRLPMIFDPLYVRIFPVMIGSGDDCLRHATSGLPFSKTAVFGECAVFESPLLPSSHGRASRALRVGGLHPGSAHANLRGHRPQPVAKLLL